MRFAWLVVAASLLVTVKARAQCTPNDALSGARRARHVVEAVQRANALVDDDLADVTALESAVLSKADRDRWLVYGAGLGGGQTFQMMPVCTTAGWSKGTFDLAQWGVIAGARHETTGLELRLQVHRVSDDLHSRESNEGRADLDVTQTALAASLGFQRWARIELVDIEPLSAASKTDDRGVSILSQQASSHGRLALGIGVPALRLGALGLVDTSAGGVETARIGVSRLPIGKTPLRATAAILVLRDEEQTASLLGLGYSVDKPTIATQEGSASPPREQVLDERATHLIYAETSFERPRLRHARLHLETSGSKHTLSTSKKRTVAYGHIGIHGDLTYFGSEHFVRQSGPGRSSGVVGASCGASFQLSSRYASLAFDMSGGVNRPETLARLNAARGVGEGQGMLYLRLGGGR